MEIKANDEKYVQQSYTKINPLTGLYYNRAFMKEVNDSVAKAKPNVYCMVAVDIEHFRLFNKLFGRAAGDEVIVYIAECIKRVQKAYEAIGGYMGADNFAVFMPNRAELVKSLWDDIADGINKWSNAVGFLPVFGVYEIDDLGVSSEVMYDRATSALSQVVGKYTSRIGIYTPDMEEKMEEEILLLEEIQRGLQKDEFIFYAQPQCDITTGKIVGAESLVRWKHSTKGLIPPGVFIPVLEKSGFMGAMDQYVWKRVCEWLRSCIDRGFRPVPISINVSRIDIFSMDVPAYLIDLVETYQIPEKLLKIEITESAYVEDNDKIQETVQKLREAGFLVMMDDFGSGYSSLNMLKNVAVDVLKLDMRFLDTGDTVDEKSINILESVVNMARMLGLPIIVEGVETQQQEKFLLSLGCRYCQGYYYYRPLPVEQFEEILMDERRLDHDGIRYTQVESLHVREFLDDNLFNDSMVNNILGPIAFYEMNDSQITITRVNEQYYRLAGVPEGEVLNYKRRLSEHVRDDDRGILFTIFEQAYQNKEKGADGHIHFIRMDGVVLWVYMKVFFLKEKEGRRVFYGSLVDATDIRKDEMQSKVEVRNVEELSEQQYASLERHFGDLPCGYSVAKIVLDASRNACDFEVLYVNQELAALCGGKQDVFAKMIWKIIDNDKEEVLQKAYRAAYEGECTNYHVRSHVTGRYLNFVFYQYEYGYVACMLRDVTNVHIHEDALKSMLNSYREVYYLNLQDNYYRMIYPSEDNLLERGNFEESINRHFRTGKVVNKDEKKVRRFLALENLREKLTTQDSVELAYRRRTKDGEMEWSQTNVAVSERDEQGHPTVAIITIRSIDKLMKETKDKRRQQMIENFRNMSEGFFVYRASEGEQILYANPRLVQMFGCDTVEEFYALVNHSFKGMVHPEDYLRIKNEIEQQIASSKENVDYIQYRIVDKNGRVRWVEDYGYLEKANADGDLFYVYIADITDKITEMQKAKFFKENKEYNKDRDNQ